MDGLDFHPYPVPQSLPFATGYAERARRERLEPAADLPGLLRRRSTARRSGRSASRRAAGCRVSLNEMGIQTDAAGQPGYSGHRGERERGRRRGRRSSRPRPTRRPATSRCSTLLACDPNVRVLNLFHLVDEPNLAGWQSGLYWVGTTGAGRQAVRRRSSPAGCAQTGGACQGKPVPVDSRRRRCSAGRATRTK